MWKPASTAGLIAIIVLAGLVFRVVRILEENYIDKDAIVYLSMADDMAEGRISEAFGTMPRIPPLYVVLMACGKRLGMGTEAAGLAVSILAGVLLIIPVFFIARELAGEKAAAAAAFLAATHPYLIRDSAEVMRDSLFFTLLFSSLAFAITAAAKEKFSRGWYFCGFFAALAVLTRSEGNEMPIAFGMWLAYEFFSRWRKGELRSALRRLLPSAAALFVGFILVAGPAQIFLFRNGSDWTILDKRFISYGKSFVKLSKEQIISTEGQ